MRTDPALNLLLSQLQQCSGPTLVIADEQLDCAAIDAGRRDIQYISNRYDIADTLRRRGADVYFNDFDFTRFAAHGLRQVIYRISKEKPLVHHIISSAARLLADGGSLVLIGHKNEGLDSYRKKAAVLLGGSVTRTRTKKGYTALSIARGESQGSAPDDSAYTTPRLAVSTSEGTDFYSKPGVYGWQKIDRGSELLIEVFKQHLAQRPPQIPPSVLDLGCGYGFLSVMAAHLTGGRVVATDNNCAAITVCEKNFARYNIDGQVIADDCGAHIEERFDFVLCNPPFHQGFDTKSSLTDKFLQQAHAHTSDGGTVFFVVNEFIEIEARAASLFSQRQELARTNGFKVYRLGDACPQ